MNNIPPGYKMSPLGVIPQDWEVRRLGEVCDFMSGGTPSKEIAAYWNGDIPWISASTMHEQNVYKSDLNISDAGLESGSRLALKGSLLLLVRGSMLWKRIPICLCLRDVAFNQDVKAIIPNHFISSSQFLLYWFLSNENNLLHSVVGTGIGAGKLETSDLKSRQIGVPPLAEQERIAEVLGTWDVAIEKQRALVDALTHRKRALMQQLLTARKRLPNFSASWQEVKLVEIGVFLKGKGVPKDKIISRGNPCLTYGDIYTKFDYVIKNISQFIADDTAAESQELIKGDVLFAGSGETLQDIGKNVAFMGDTPTYAGGDIVIFRPKIEVDSVTLSYILASEDCSKQKYRYGQGHSVVHIYAKDISKLSFRLPPLEEQKAISQILTTADREIELATKKLNTLRTQKRALMQQLLTGKKRLKL